MLCERLEQADPSVRFAGIFNGKLSSGRGTRVVFPPEILDVITGAAARGAARTVLLPVNYGNHHWCGIVVDAAGNAIRYYDSLNGWAYKTALDLAARTLVDEVLPGFSVAAINSPLQYDSYSCGFFVATKFWRLVERSAPHDLSLHSHLARRFDFLCFVFSGTAP